MSQPKRLSQEEAGALARRLKTGDARALGELYDSLAPWVLGLAFRILRDEAEAEDVVAEVFEHVWRRIDQHDERRGSLVPWVLAIARHRALDALRRRRRWWRKRQAVESGDIELATAPHEASVPGWPLHRAVHEALASLPAEQRRVVLLAYFEGLSHSEIARRLGQPLGTVKTRLRIAHQTLTDHLRRLKDWLE